MISALGWEQAGVEISVHEFNTDYEEYSINETRLILTGFY
jgi:hypothetical protein